MGFKPQAELKPTFLIKDCTLTEFNKFTETFLTYMRSSGSTVPAEALWGQLNVNMDSYWFTELKDKGFTRQCDLTSFQTLMDDVALIKFPIHQRRMVVFGAKQTGDLLSYLRELIEHIRVSDWTTFNEEASACHLFINSVKCEESKRACFKILSKSQQGDLKSLITKLQSIEAYPDKEVAIKPVLVRDSCMACYFKGHGGKDCWGKCQHCGKYGHKSHLCRNKRRMRI